MIRVGLITALVLNSSPGRESGSVGGFGANPSTVVEEDDGDGNKRGGNAAKQGGSPLDTHTLEHVGGEERETGTGERTEEGVTGDGGGGEHEVRVDQVVEGLKEDGGQTEAGEDTGEGGHDPVDLAAVARPAEQKRPAEKATPPAMTLGRRHSGMGTPLLALSLRMYHGCCRRMVTPARIWPVIMPKKVRPATPGVMP